MSTPNSALIEKVRRLRALSQSENVHEAAAAATAAERLIQENNLSEAALHTDGSDEEIDVDRDVADLGGKIASWQNSLLAQLSRAYQCSGMYEWRWHDRAGGRGGYTNTYVAYGRPADLATLRYQFAFFTTEITRLTASLCKGRGRTYANNFRRGAVSAIAEALYTVTREARKVATSTALVVVDRRLELAKARKDQEWPDLKTRRSGGSTYDAEAFAAGKRAGTGINQRSAMGAGGSRLLGSGSGSK